MILAIDIGNTNIVMGALDGSNVVLFERAKTYDGSVNFLVQRIKKYSYDAAILSSVVPSVNEGIIKLVKETFGIDVIMVNADMRLNFTLDIPNKHDLGSDIIVGLAAAIDEYGCPVAVIDMGTASTIFTVDKSGRFVGGTINTGIGLELKGLSHSTAQLPKIAFKTPEKVLNTVTDDCMRAGILYGHAGMIDGILKHMEAELGYPITAIATGGLGRYVAPLCTHEIVYDDQLLIKGLRLIYELNK